MNRQEIRQQEFDRCGKEFGFIDFEGKTYALTRYAYADTDAQGRSVYECDAISTEADYWDDDRCKRYNVVWYTTEKWYNYDELYKIQTQRIESKSYMYPWYDYDRLQELVKKLDLEDVYYESFDPDWLCSYLDDESNACDWDQPYDVKEV